MDSFFRNPIVIAIGWLGGLAGIISIPLSIYLASSKPNITYYYGQDSYFKLVSREGLSKLKVLHSATGEEIINDLSIVKVKVWNSGNRVAKSEDVRESLTLQSSDDIKIIEASILDSENNYFKPAVKDNSVILPFDVLEPGEGNTIQLLYMGGTKAGFVINGKVIGQKIIEKWSPAPGAEVVAWVIVVSFALFLSGMLVKIVITLINKTNIYRGEDGVGKAVIIFIDKYASIPMGAFAISLIYLLFATKLGEVWLLPI